jgi:hypothetical protein
VTGPLLLFVFVVFCFRRFPRSLVVCLGLRLNASVSAVAGVRPFSTVVEVRQSTSVGASSTCASSLRSFVRELTTMATALAEQSSGVSPFVVPTRCCRFRLPRPLLLWVAAVRSALGARNDEVVTDEVRTDFLLRAKESFT